MTQPESTATVRFVGSGAELETLPPKQRRYTAAYKLRLIEMADACTAPGELASLLRKEGIYSATLADFRKQKSRGDLERKPGSAKSPKPAVPATLSPKEQSALERENRRLRRELEKVHILLDLQKKVSDLMGISLDPQE